MRDIVWSLRCDGYPYQRLRKQDFETELMKAEQQQQQRKQQQQRGQQQRSDAQQSENKQPQPGEAAEGGQEMSEDQVTVCEWTTSGRVP